MAAILETYRAKIGEFEKARREVERVRKEAIDELLRHRREITTQLRQLGYDGDRKEDAARNPGIAMIADELRSSPNGEASARQETVLENGHKRRRFKGSRTFDQAYCSICQLRGHDLRAHRGQEPKRAFSGSEMAPRNHGR